MASVKVAVRVRPFNERELALNSKCIIKMEHNKTIIMNQKAPEVIDNTHNSQHMQSTSAEGSAATTVPTSTTTTTTTSLPNGGGQSAMASVTSMIAAAARERFKEFVYDSSYWSFDSNDENFVSQEDVFNDLGMMTLNNAFDGYNACVCAYGQTGSGKSFTMMGAESNEGLIPRICKVSQWLSLTPVL